MNKHLANLTASLIGVIRRQHAQMPPGLGLESPRPSIVFEGRIVIARTQRSEVLALLGAPDKHEPGPNGWCDDTYWYARDGRAKISALFVTYHRDVVANFSVYGAGVSRVAADVEDVDSSSAHESPRHIDVAWDGAPDLSEFPTGSHFAERAPDGEAPRDPPIDGPDAFDEFLAETSHGSTAHSPGTDDVATVPHVRHPDPASCDCVHRFEFAERPSDVVLYSILSGTVTTRARVEELIGKPSYERCERCPGHDVEYVFTNDGAPAFPVLTLIYRDDDTVANITAYTSPIRRPDIPGSAFEERSVAQ